MLSNFITNCVNQVAKDEGFIDFQIETTIGSKNGDNFLGVMTAITVSGIRLRNGIHGPDKLYLICKAPPLSEIRRETWKSGLLFEREIYMYSKVFPAFVQFQQEKGLSESDSFLAFPKVFMCDVNEENDSYILIMEDLRAKNFVMWPKEELISLDHELLVLRELGKFHAISFAMKDQRPNEFDEFTHLKDLIYEILVNGSLNKWFGTVLDRTVEVLHKMEHQKIIENFRRTFDKRIKHLLVELPTIEKAVILHGDCWNNNFLFKYSDENRNELNGINFVDFQLSFYGSPAIDVLYNIYTSTDKKFRDKHYKTLLNTYYTSLSEMIRKLGSDPDQLYSFDEFQMQLRKFGEFALFIAPVIYILRLADEENVMDVEEFAERLANDEDVDLIPKFTGEAQKRWTDIMNGTVIDLLKYGNIQK